MRLAGGIHHGSFTERDQGWVKRDWLNAPDARPIHRAMLFFSEAKACLARFLIHRRQNAGIQIALIERRLASSHHRSHYSRERFDAAHGTPGGGMLTRNCTNF